MNNNWLPVNSNVKSVGPYSTQVRNMTTLSSSILNTISVEGLEAGMFGAGDLLVDDDDEGASWLRDDV